MKRYLVMLVCVLAVLVVAAQYFHVDVEAADSGDVASLKATHQKYLKAWSDWDIDTIVEIGTGAAGFGHSTAFPRPVRVRDTFREGVKSFYDMMEVFTINILTENYNVVGDTGVAWGHYACTTKQKAGPQRTLYLRYAHTFSRIDGKWSLVMYHRSFMTAVDNQ